MQGAYLLGRNDALDYGGVGCQVYLEADLADAGADPARLSEAWRTLIDRHPMLRAVVDERGYQQVRSAVPRYDIPVLDLRDAPPGRAEEGIAAVRDELCRRSYEPGSWPMFDVRLSRTAGRSVLHFSADLMIADFVSIQLLLDELHRLSTGRTTRCRAANHVPRLPGRRTAARGRRAYRQARDYWWRRIDDLPPAPKLPMRADPVRRGHAEFRRWQTRLEADEWVRLQELTASNGLTPSGAVLAAYAETIARWTAQDAFTLAVTVLNRLPVHEDADRLVGDFSSVNLLEVRPRWTTPSATRPERCRSSCGPTWTTAPAPGSRCCARWGRVAAGPRRSADRVHQRHRAGQPAAGVLAGRHAGVRADPDPAGVHRLPGADSERHLACQLGRSIGHLPGRAGRHHVRRLREAAARPRRRGRWLGPARPASVARRPGRASPRGERHRRPRPARTPVAARTAGAAGPADPRPPGGGRLVGDADLRRGPAPGDRPGARYRGRGRAGRGDLRPWPRPADRRARRAARRRTRTCRSIPTSRPSGATGCSPTRVCESC